MNRACQCRAFTLSGVVSSFIVFGFLCLLVFFIFVFFDTDSHMEIHRVDSETSRMASLLFFEKMVSISQASIALLGGAWALITLTDTRIQFSKLSVVAGFVVFNLSMTVSLLIYYFGYDFIVERVFYHLAFDMEAPYVMFYKNFQSIFFVYGVFSLGMMVLFGRK